MSVVSGQYGNVQIGSSEILEVLSWNWSRKANVHQYASNNTSGYKKTVVGTKSGSGSVRGVWDSTDPAEDHLGEGDDVNLKLYTTASKYHLVPATIENFDVECDIDDGAPLGWTANFVCDGAWTENQT